jgi:hypothetical protein
MDGTNMMITVKTWLDSGANCESRYEVVFEVDKHEWLDMNEQEQEEYAKDYAWNRMDWGHEVVEETFKHD